MNTTEIKEKLKMALEAIEDVPEPFKQDAFKIILNNVLWSSIKGSEAKPERISSVSTTNGTDDDQSLSILAEKVGTKLENLKNVLDIDNGEFILLKKINENTDAKKQVMASQIIITAYMKGMNKEWIRASVLRDVVEKNGLGNPKNFASNLDRTDIFRIKGEGKATEYSLTVEGWQQGLELIRTMAGT